MANIPAGTWTIDKSHSEVSFSVRHLMISKVKGSFKDFEGTIVTTDDPEQTLVTGSIDPASIDTNDKGRNEHLRSGDFFETEKFPAITFESTSVKAKNDEDFIVEGNLTMHGVTKTVTLKAELGGVVVDGYGQTKLAVSAKGKLLRSDFGLTWNTALESGGVLVSDEITLTVEAQAVLQA